MVRGKLNTSQPFQGNWGQTGTLFMAVDVHHISVVMCWVQSVATDTVEAGISVVLMTVHGGGGSATR